MTTAALLTALAAYRYPLPSAITCDAGGMNTLALAALAAWSIALILWALARIPPASLESEWIVLEVCVAAWDPSKRQYVWNRGRLRCLVCAAGIAAAGAALGAIVIFFC